MTRDVLVLVAHPNDDVIGLGGTIARHVAMRDKVRIVVAAEGATSRDVVRDVPAREAELEELQAATHKAVEILGGRRFAYWISPITGATALIAWV